MGPVEAEHLMYNVQSTLGYGKVPMYAQCAMALRARVGDTSPPVAVEY